MGGHWGGPGWSWGSHLEDGEAERLRQVLGVPQVCLAAAPVQGHAGHGVEAAVGPVQALGGLVWGEQGGQGGIEGSRGHWGDMGEHWGQRGHRARDIQGHPVQALKGQGDMGESGGGLGNTGTSLGTEDRPGDTFGDSCGTLTQGQPLRPLHIFGHQGLGGGPVLGPPGDVGAGPPV